ncbi:MAG: hypothetical protein JW395_2175 [Nitrospira sp.]|nr:hypothetical protein [Nitrospira sp.]
MKYGGQGGWRGIKRLNRDARVADGSPPYGYRTRYDGARESRGGNSTSNGQAWEEVLHGSVSVISSIRASDSNGWTSAEYSKLAKSVDAFELVVNRTIEARPGFWGRFFFGEDRWRSEYQQMVVSQFQVVQASFKGLMELSDDRGKSFAATMRRLNKFGNAIDRRYANPILELISPEELIAIKKYSDAVSNLNSMGNHDRMGKMVHWEELKERIYSIFPALVDHVVLSVRLHSQHFVEPAPQVEVDRNTRSISVGDLQLELSFLPKTSTKRKKTKM